MTKEQEREKRGESVGHIPQGSISGPADQPDWEFTVPCSIATMEMPCEWVWERESHGHQKGKQLSFITAVWAIDRTKKTQNPVYIFWYSFLNLIFLWYFFQFSQLTYIQPFAVFYPLRKCLWVYCQVAMLHFFSPQPNISNIYRYAELYREVQRWKRRQGGPGGECQREIVSFTVSDVFLLLDNVVYRFKALSLQLDPLTLGFPGLLNALI